MGPQHGHAKAMGHGLAHRLGVMVSALLSLDKNAGKKGNFN